MTQQAAAISPRPSARSRRALGLLVALALGAACNRDFSFIQGRDAGAAGGVCADEDLGSVTGSGVARGTTVGAGNELRATCVSATGDEVAYRWTAPRTGTFTFDTNGSGFDTVLHIFEGSACSGASVACDDDMGESQASLITRTVTAGQLLVIVVDSFNTSSGTYILNINSAP